MWQRVAWNTELWSSLSAAVNTGSITQCCCRSELGSIWILHKGKSIKSIYIHSLVLDQCVLVSESVFLLFTISPLEIHTWVCDTNIYILWRLKQDQPLWWVMNTHLHVARALVTLKIHLHQAKDRFLMHSSLSFPRFRVNDMNTFCFASQTLFTGG